MPPPYPLHGSGSLGCWNALPGYHVLRGIKNRSYFLIVFQSHFGSILAQILEAFWTLFDIQIDPSSVQDAFPSLINAISTKTFKHQ